MQSPMNPRGLAGCDVRSRVGADERARPVFLKSESFQEVLAATTPIVRHCRRVIDTHENSNCVNGS